MQNRINTRLSTRRRGNAIRTGRSVGSVVETMEARRMLAVIAGPIVNPANGHQYYLLSPNTWTASQTEAQRLGGNLVTVNNSSENTWVILQFAPQGARPLWIGLNDMGIEGRFEWVSGQKSSFVNWTPGEPNGRAGEDYVMVWNAANPFNQPATKWNDATNSSLLYGVVEVEPEVEVRGNNVVIADGDTTASTTDHTDFGSVNVGSPLTRTFTVRNTGTAALTTSGLSVPSGFTIDPADRLNASIPAGGSDTFKVKLNATAAGTFTGNISFANNDSNENPYNFAIRGVVNVPTFSLVNGVLTVTGTSGNDFIRGSIANNVLTMKMNSLTQTFANASTISRIVVNALAGNDNITMGASVNRPTSLNGGDGNDSIYGGSGTDVIDGGAGTDFATRTGSDTTKLVEEILA
jgi:Ca2+-binding RTX toxin-like protein